jgi:hypothetical protein
VHRWRNAVSSPQQALGKTRLLMEVADLVEKQIAKSAKTKNRGHSNTAQHEIESSRFRHSRTVQERKTSILAKAGVPNKGCGAGSQINRIQTAIYGGE